MVSVWILARKRPAPREHLVFTCSGLMYAAVPRIAPAVVSIAESVGELEASEAAPRSSSAFASLKSRTFAVPSYRTFTFGGSSGG
jgi:hypothetical protein